MTFSQKDLYTVYPYISSPRRSRGRLLRYIAAFIFLFVSVATVTTACVNGTLQAAFQDPGVAMCNEIKTDVEQHISGGDNYVEIRAKFMRSQYADLRLAGPAFIDAMTPFIGTTRDQQSAAILLMGGTILERWGGLVGACGAHGVQLPNQP